MPLSSRVANLLDVRDCLSGLAVDCVREKLKSYPLLREKIDLAQGGVHGVAIPIGLRGSHPRCSLRRGPVAVKGEAAS